MYTVNWCNLEFQYIICNLLFFIFNVENTLLKWCAQLCQCTRKQYYVYCTVKCALCVQVLIMKFEVHIITYKLYSHCEQWVPCTLRVVHTELSSNVFYPYPFPILSLSYPYPIPILSLSFPFPIPILSYPYPIPILSLSYPYMFPISSLSYTYPIPILFLSYPISILSI